MPTETILDHNTESEAADTFVTDLADEIKGTMQVAFDSLIERRDEALTAQITPLDTECTTLLAEYDQINTASLELAAILPSRARLAQLEADQLTVQGKHDAARLKLEEMEAANNAPAALEARQREITARVAAIDDEKKAIARRTFDRWYGELQQIIRAAETGLFLGMLDKGRDQMHAYQNAHGLQGTVENPFDFLVKDYHLMNLTAPDRSDEWISGSQWYGGRGRR